MSNEEIFAEFTKLANEGFAQASAEFEGRRQELKLEAKIERVAPKWKLKPSYIITDVTHDGYGN